MESGERQRGCACGEEAGRAPRERVQTAEEKDWSCLLLLLLLLLIAIDHLFILFSRLCKQHFNASHVTPQVAAFQEEIISVLSDVRHTRQIHSDRVAQLKEIFSCRVTDLRLLTTLMKDFKR